MEEVDIMDDWSTTHPAFGTMVKRKLRGKWFTEDLDASEFLEMITNTRACPDLFNVDPVSPNFNARRDVTHRATAAKLLYRAKHHRHDILLLDHSLPYIRYIPAPDIIINSGTDPRPRAWIDVSSGIHISNGKSHTNAPIAFGKGGPLDATSINQAIVTKSDLITFPDVSSEVINPLNFPVNKLYFNVPATVHQGTNSPCPS